MSGYGQQFDEPSVNSGAAVSQMESGQLPQQPMTFNNVNYDAPVGQSVSDVPSIVHVVCSIFPSNIGRADDDVIGI